MSVSATATTTAAAARRGVAVRRPARRSGASRVSSLRPARAQKEEEEEFKRSEFQEKIKVADDAVKKTQKDVGAALNSFMASSGLGKALGISSSSSTAPDSPAASSSGPNSKDLGRSGQSKKWLDARGILLDNGIASVSGKEIGAMMDKCGAVILDVRPKEDYESFHALGATNAQYYRYPDSSDMFTISMLRQAAYAAQGVKAVEKNAIFVQDALAAIGDAEVVVVACASGGTMTETDNFPVGQASRSLLAAAELMSSGKFSKVKFFHMKGGLNAWFKAGLSGEGASDKGYDDKSGSVPFVAGYSVEQDAEELKD